MPAPVIIQIDFKTVEPLSTGNIQLRLITQGFVNWLDGFLLTKISKIK